MRRAALAASLVALVACGRDAAARSADARAAARDRRLYADLSAPLAGGADALRAALADVSARPLAFDLTIAGATRRAGPPRAAEIADEAVLVVFRLRDGRALLFEPRGYALTPLPTGTTTIVRALPSGGWRGEHGLDVARFDVVVDERDVAVRGARRLTDGGDASSAVAWPERGLAVYVAGADEDTASSLRAVALAGGPPRPLAPELTIGFAPRRLADGSLVVAGGPADGALRLWRLAADGAPPAPYDAPADDHDAGAYALGVVERDGVALPTLLEVPEKPTLPALAALVEARDAAIARRRALLAATLIEARQLKLAHLPTLAAGLYDVPSHGIAVAPGNTGDVLAEGLARGVIGVVAPLLDWRRVDALAQAGVARARIARDALDLEVEDRLGDALAHGWAARAWSDSAALDDRAVAVAEAEAAAVARRAAVAGTVGEVERLAAERDRVAASGRREAHRRELALHLDELRRLAALPAASPLDPSDLGEPPAEDRGFADLRRLAELNQPRLRAARAALAEAFQLGRAGGDARPSLALGVDYGQTRDRFRDPVDDYVLLSLNGSLPTSWFADRRLAADRQERVVAALRAAEEAEATRLASELEEAYVAYHRARADAATAAAGAAEHAERAREARLQAERGRADPDAALDAAQLAAIERDALVAAGDAVAARAESAMRLARLWRLAGLCRGVVHPFAPNTAVAAGDAHRDPPCD